MLGVLIVLVGLQRLWELQIAASNVAYLKKRGAVEYGREHYPVMVLLHSLWLGCMVAEWWKGDLFLHQALVGIGWIFFLTGQALRWWTIRTLGRRWTTRVLILPGEPLVAEGPFRFLSHPNYLGVTLEIFGLPLIGGCWKTSVVFGCLNILLLKHRKKIENAALQAGISGGDGRVCEAS